MIAGWYVSKIKVRGPGLQDQQFRNFTDRILLFFPSLCDGFWLINYKPLTSTELLILADYCWGLVMLTYITESLLFSWLCPTFYPVSITPPSLIACVSVSRETIRSKKKSDYNLNKTNAPILTNTTLNVIRLVGESCTCMNAHLHRLPLLESTKRSSLACQRFHLSPIMPAAHCDWHAQVSTATVTALH